MSYDKAFFESIRPGVQRSAAAVVPRLVDLIKPASVTDIGCGEGWWLNEFRARGVSIAGLDSIELADGMPLRYQHYRCVDLSQPLPREFDWSSDLCLSLEVAEHLPPARAESFVADLCAFAPVVLFSAAIPGQGGEGHVNEAWPSYWVELFERCGYHCFDFLRWEFWADQRVDAWYRQNMMLFVRHPGEDWDTWHLVQQKVGSAQFVGDVVHPEILHAIRYDTYNRWRATGQVPEVKELGK